MFTGVLGIALFLTWQAVRNTPAPIADTHDRWPLLVAAFAAGHFAGIDVRFRKQSHALDLTDVVLLPAIVFASPSHAVLAAALGTALRSALGRRPVMKAAFNVVLHGFATSVAVLAYQRIDLAVTPGTRIGLGILVTSPRGVLAAVLAVAAAELVTCLGIQAVIALSTGRVAPDVLQQMGPTLLIMVGVDTLLGLVAVFLYRDTGTGGVLFLVVAAVAGAGYAQYGRLRSRHGRLEQLYRFEQALAGVFEREEVTAAVLHEAVTLFNAEVAELVSLDGARVSWHSLRLGEEVTVTGSGRHALAALAETVRYDLLASRRSTDVDVIRALRASGHRDAVVVRLPSEDREHRVLVVADRLGDAEATFTTADLSLAQALATPTAMALRNSDLLAQLRTEVATKRYQAAHDGLTGLPNRTSFSAEVDRVLAARQGPDVVGVMLMDLDGFKKLNDTLGHEAGDGFLQLLARRLTAVLGDEGTAGRLGGDEFAVVVPAAGSAERVAALAQELDRAVRAPVALAGSTVQLRASIGVAVAPYHGEDRSILLRQADLAMYRAKQRGGGVRVQNDRYTDHIDRFSLITALREAINTSGLRLLYQPKVSFETGAVTGVEALLRWTHPLYGVIEPAQFVPVAEASGLIRPITRWVLDTALHQAARWHDEGLTLDVAVNLSPEQVGDLDLVTQTRAILGRHGLPAGTLIFELTESDALRDWGGDSQSVLDDLAAMGVRLAIDDFGVGTSSLTRLKNLRVDELKVDKSFIAHLTEDPTDAAIVASTINLGHQLGLSVTAEGIETDVAYQRLLELGCDTAQGYLLSVPLPASELTPWLHAHAEPTPQPHADVVPLRARAQSQSRS